MAIKKPFSGFMALIVPATSKPFKWLLPAVSNELENLSKSKEGTIFPCVTLVYDMVCLCCGSCCCCLAQSLKG